jgi:hypothetical protein
MQRVVVKYLVCASILTVGTIVSGCAVTPKLARPQELNAPRPIPNNMGKYMCPYTQDGVMAEWTDKAINAKIGATIGKHAGAYVGQKAVEQIPFIGGMLGSAVGKEAGRKIAIESSGGMETIKNSSDLSFNSFDDMSLYLYVNYSSHEHYKDAFAAASAIYPELQEAYYPALARASKNARKNQ